MERLQIKLNKHNHRPDLFSPDNGQVYGLYMVTYVYKDERNAAFTSMVYVLAQSAEDAIAQGDDIAVGPFRPSALEGPQALQDGRLKATAVRIPFLIRGYGRNTF